MPRRRMHFAPAALAAVSLTLGGIAVAAHARAAAAPPAQAAALEAGLWQLASGSGNPYYPFDPLTLVGPPVPLAILYAPAAPLSAGVRIELEPGATPAAAGRRAPEPEALVRYRDVFTRLVPMRHADGSLSIDLTGVYMTDVRASLDGDGVHVSTDGATPAAAER